MNSRKKIITCESGHKFYKSSDCLSCPICEKNKEATGNFLDLLSAPARRALENEGILTLDKLSTYTEKEVLRLHGLGKSTIPVLQKLLKQNRKSFKRQ